MQYVTDDENKPESPEEIQFSDSKIKIPLTPDKPKHDKATASIYIEGLSILCPNEAEKTVEIAFVKEDHSGVEVKIYKKGCKLYGSYQFSNEEKVQIAIQKTNPVGMGKLFKTPKKEDDDEDFGWLPDLSGSDWHPAADIKIRRGAEDHLSAKLILQDATFYNHLKSVSDGKQDRKDGRPARNLGKVGRILGADIICDAGDTEVIVRIKSASGTVINQPLPKSGGPYSISVTTRPTDAGSHLHHLYHHILEITPRQPEYDFKYQVKEAEWYLCDKPNKFTTFACQTFGGGDGPVPDLV